MKKKAKDPADEPCQLFQFLLRTTVGPLAVVYTIPKEDADSIARVFEDFGTLAAGRQFIEFSLVNRRVVLLNLTFLLGASRLNLVGRAGDQEAQPVNRNRDGVELHDWQSLSNSKHPPDLALLIDGLAKPLACQELTWDVIAQAAMVLQEEPATAMVTFTDEEDLRTRYIPAENIILMESIEYHRLDGA